ncbi:hypothetical protein CCAX7_19240 [Capsulimonas corticalis]|uniref:Uncharacterized protein n=1 Tax=Capsulimonas corticalis TaxID=2219043 RepID=A0A402D583_9BACT|nr:hypothetical protein CCAX7_19240 [Capsulimonas corticalis]
MQPRRDLPLNADNRLAVVGVKIPAIEMRHDYPNAGRNDQGSKENKTGQSPPKFPARAATRSQIVKAEWLHGTAC